MQKLTLSQPVFELTDFENGLNGWDFKYWLPEGRELQHGIVDTGGFVSKHCYAVYSDGGDDDGVFFLQKILKADIESPFHNAGVAWAFKAHKSGDVTAWPRVVYVGPPKDLAIRDHKDKFHFFHADNGTSTCETCEGWFGQIYKTTFDRGLEELQICVGFKINWETKRTVYLDNLLLNAA